MPILTWDIYEIRCDCATLHGIKLRGRIRKFSLEQQITCLMENASDEENIVRFAILADSDSSLILAFISTLIPEAIVTQVLTRIPNPVLSKLKVNDTTRYII